MKNFFTKVTAGFDTAKTEKLINAFRGREYKLQTLNWLNDKEGGIKYMSDFIAKITATVDTTKAAAQLNALTKERKINVQADVKGNGVDNLNNSIQQAQKGASGLSASFKEIAGAKLKYDAINAIKTQADNAVKAVTDLNQAMTLVNMTMSSMTDASLNSLKQQSLSMARELSTYTKNCDRCSYHICERE